MITSRHLHPDKPTDKGGRAVGNRRFIEAVLFIARTGCPWLDLSKAFGN
ncbi:transposase [Chitinivorax tropicus]